MKKYLLMVVAAAVSLGAFGVECEFSTEAVPKFAEAESVWPRGLETEMNTLVAFRAPFDLKAGERPILKLVAWYSYRVTLNGKFVAFGPARGPKGYFRADELDLAPVARVGRNELMIEVAGYCIPNFYLMEQPPFLKAEVVVDGVVRAATKTSASAFAATLQPRVKKVPRYTFQRTFSEVYRLPGPASQSPLALAAAPEPTLIPRRAPYPKYEFNPKMQLVSFAKVRADEKKKLHNDRSIKLPGTTPTFKGYRLDELEVNSNYLAQRLVSSERRAATADEKAQSEFAFKAGESAVFDNGLCDTGFPGLRVTVREPGRLALQFDEVLFEDGGARGILRYRDCCNVIVWDFTEPGVYEVDSFEPYTMRYVEVDVLSGAMTISAPRFRSYKNPTAAAAEFRASDPDLVKIFDAAKETFRQNAVDVFMDCPSRERAGWNCDAYFTAPVSTLLTGNGNLEKVFEENLALPKFDDIPEGMFPMCYPSDHRGGRFIPNWAMWFVLESEEYLKRTGDREMIERLRPRFEKLIDFFWKFRNSDGLLEKLPSWVFVEWSRSNRLVQDVNYPSNMTWADVLDAMNRLYGRADLAAEAKRVRAEIIRQSWTGKWFCDNSVRQKDGTLKLSGECTETCQYYAFFHRTATPESHPELWKTMLTDFGPQRYDPNDRKKLLKHPEIWPSNAFIGNYLRLKLLERHGLGAQILRETKGYFKYMADRTGTLWENDTTCASCNHGFASYVAVLLVRSVLGIDVDAVSKTVTVRKTDADLDFCGVTLPVGDERIVFDRVKKNGSHVDTYKLPDGWRLVNDNGVGEWNFKSAVLSPDTSVGVVDEGGALVTTLPSKRTCCWWERQFKVAPGKGVRVTAEATITPVDDGAAVKPWNDVMMFVKFYDAKKGNHDKTSFFKASYARYTDDTAVGCVRRFDDTFAVPDGCDTVKIELVSKWHAMKIVYRNVSVAVTDAPKPRKVRCVAGNPWEKGPKELGLSWDDPKAVMKARLGQIESCLKRIFAEVEKPDLILFSEGFVATGCPDPKVLAEKIPGGPSFELASRYAKKYHCYIAMNPKEVTDEGTYHNCVFIVDRDGRLVGKQHKTTLTSGEFKDGLLPDEDYQVFDCDFGRIGSLVCWENWFSETAKFLKRRGAELLLFPLAGCAADHVDITFPARAIDTGIPFIVAMRQRHLPNGIIDRDGKWIAKTFEDGGYAWADIDLNERKRTFWLSVGPGGGDPNELYFDESRPEIYSKQPYGPRR